VLVDVLTLPTCVGELVHNAVYKVAISRCEGFHEERLANWLVWMVERDLRIAPILADFESYRRLCFTSGKMLVYCDALGRRHLMNCLLFFIVPLRLSCCHLCVSKQFASKTHGTVLQMCAS